MNGYNGNFLAMLLDVMLWPLRAFMPRMDRLRKLEPADRWWYPLVIVLAGFAMAGLLVGYIWYSIGTFNILYEQSRAGARLLASWMLASMLVCYSVGLIVAFLLRAFESAWVWGQGETPYLKGEPLSRFILAGLLFVHDILLNTVFGLFAWPVVLFIVFRFGA